MKSELGHSIALMMAPYERAQRGHIALQDYGDAVWFRNITIRPM